MYGTREDTRSFAASPSATGDKNPLRLGRVQADGHVRQGGGDVKSEINGRRVYIPHVDVTMEWYRLATFAQYREYEKVKAWRFAEAGFFYTGEDAKTKCFSCGSEVERSQVMVDPSSLMWHKEDCSMVDGTNKENVPYEEAPRKKLLTLRDLVQDLFSREPTDGITGNHSLKTARERQKSDDYESNNEGERQAEKEVAEEIPPPDGPPNDAVAAAVIQGSRMSDVSVRYRKRSGSEIEDGTQSGGKRGPRQ